MKQYLIIALALTVPNTIAQNSTSTQATLASCTVADHPTSYNVCLSSQCTCKSSIESCQVAGGTNENVLVNQCIAASEAIFNTAISSVSGCECDVACSAATASSIDCSLPTCTANDHPTSYSAVISMCPIFQESP